MDVSFYILVVYRDFLREGVLSEDHATGVQETLETNIEQTHTQAVLVMIL